MQTHMMHLATAVLAALVVAVTPVATGARGAATISNADKNFVSAAAEANAQEIAQGRMQSSAETKIGANLARPSATMISHAKAFAGRMITDHGQSQHELHALATQLGLTAQFWAGESAVSAAIPMDPQDYLRDEVATHQHLVGIFEREAVGGTNPSLVKWAKQTLPVLEVHLALAQQYLQN